MSDIDLTQADANSLARGAPRLPTIPAAFGTDPKEMIGAIKEIIEVREGQRGSRLDKSITWRDLFDQGVIALNIDGKAYYNAPGGGVVPAPANNGSIDQSPPPAPTGLEAVGALASIIISWDRPTYGNNAHAYTEIWSSGTNDLGSATLIGTSPSQFYVDVTGSGAVRYYWIRWVSKFPVTGPFNGTAGTRGETGYDASYLIDVLKANPPPGVNYNPLLWVNADPNLVVNGVPVPLGTYMQAAYIADGTISRAKIGLAAIDDARIANLSAAKITAGDIDANRMRANIVQAVQGQFVSLSAVTANLGTVTISQFGYLRTENALTYGFGTGIYLGWDASTYKFRVGTPGGQGLFWDGTNLSIVGSVYATGDGTFRGTFYTGSYTGYMQVPIGQGGGYIGQDGFSVGVPISADGDPRYPAYMAVHRDSHSASIVAESLQLISRNYSIPATGDATFNNVTVGQSVTVYGNLGVAGTLNVGNIVSGGHSTSLSSSATSAASAPSAIFPITITQESHRIFYLRARSGTGTGYLSVSNFQPSSGAQIAGFLTGGAPSYESGSNGLYLKLGGNGQGSLGETGITKLGLGTYWVGFTLVSDDGQPCEMAVYARNLP